MAAEVREVSSLVIAEEAIVAVDCPDADGTRLDVMGLFVPIWML